MNESSAYRTLKLPRTHLAIVRDLFTQSRLQVHGIFATSRKPVRLQDMQNEAHIRRAGDDRQPGRHRQRRG
jgi:hypothetical protein